MKRLFLIVLTIAIILSLCACGAKSDFVGTWTKQIYQDKENFIVTDSTLTLNKNNKFVLKNSDPDQAYAEIEGTWGIEEDGDMVCIVLTYEKLIEGKDSLFNEDGSLKIGYRVYYAILENGALRNDETEWVKK